MAFRRRAAGQGCALARLLFESESRNQVFTVDSIVLQRAVNSVVHLLGKGTYFPCGPQDVHMKNRKWDPPAFGTLGMLHVRTASSQGKQSANSAEVPVIVSW